MNEKSLTTHWMQSLAEHYQKVQSKNPKQKLLILFDIDGTIIDTRYLILYVLQAYDRAHKTKFFHRLKIENIQCHEEEVTLLLDLLNIDSKNQISILNWYEAQRWSPEFIFEAHRPYQGVLEIIRWFMIQPNTEVGLNTARPERMRQDTLRCLNELGKEYRVRFRSEKLFMNPGGWGEIVLQNKVKGIQHFEAQGYQVFAFIDNEPLNLKAVAEAALQSPIMLLHADTIFQTSRKDIPQNSVTGSEYDLSTFLSKKPVTRHVQFVWQGIQDEACFNAFAHSEVFWAELPVRRDPATDQLVVRKKSFGDQAMVDGEEILLLEESLLRCQTLGRGVKLDLLENGDTIEKVDRLLNSLAWPSEQLWLHSDLAFLKEEGIQRLASLFPQAILQTSIDFSSSLILGTPSLAKQTLRQLFDWGLNRFSLKWGQKHQGQLIHILQSWGYEIHLEGIKHLETFLQATLHQPRSISYDFLSPHLPSLFQRDRISKIGAQPKQDSMNGAPCPIRDPRAIVA